MSKLHSVILAALLVAFGNAALAESFSGSGYTAAELLSPCTEADNDARWGEAAETECEQYILGFVDALAVVDAGVCAPNVNTADEVRWAYMRWVHADYSTRRNMSAAEALQETLKSAFPCS